MPDYLKLTILDALQEFLVVIRLTRSENTTRAYTNSLAAFAKVLEEHNIDPRTVNIFELSENAIGWVATYLKDYAPATEQLYITAITRFYQFLVAEDLAPINLEKVRLLAKTRTRRPGIRLPQFPKEDINKVIDHALMIPKINTLKENEHLINLRDSSFILSLADTGMRVHEICQLRRGDINWNEFKAIIIGKGDKQAVVRFSNRSIISIKAYLFARSLLDGNSGRPLQSLPVFARHDKGAGKKIKPITTTTGRNIVKRRVKQAGATGTITPHSFRHYFVTNVLNGSGGNLKLAQELARHKNIQVTQRYAHLSDDELDKGYHEIFNE